VKRAHSSWTAFIVRLLVRAFGDGAGYFDAWALARTTLGKSPAFEFHEAVDLLAVGVQSIAEAQTAPCAPDSARRFPLVDLLDAGSESFVDGLGSPLAGLVVSRGTWKADPANNRGNRERFARREEMLLYMAHEFASGRVFPRYSRAIWRNSICMVRSPILARSSFFSAL
jgi:hypothetical protein